MWDLEVGDNYNVHVHVVPERWNGWCTFPTECDVCGETTSRDKNGHCLFQGKKLHTALVHIHSAHDQMST